ncbi:MAG: PilZ domain-containing protein [Myxococcota bacterium]
MPLLVQYRFDARDELHTDYALNVSQSGLFVATLTDRPAGTRVYVQLTTRDGAHFLQGEGKVVRSAQGGCAIELSGFDDEARAILDELVREALAERDRPSSRTSNRGRR